MQLILGTNLSPKLQAKVLRSFPYRMTLESVAKYPDAAEFMNAREYRLSLISDFHWLASTHFYVTKDGKLSKRHAYCEHNASKFRKLVNRPISAKGVR